MGRPQKVLLYLTGGLGNQLFQFAALSNIDYECRKYVLANYGNPRTNSEHQPEITSLFSEELRFFHLPSLSNKLTEKIFGLNLRLTVKDVNLINELQKRAFQFLGSIGVSFLTMRLTRISNSPNPKPSRIFRTTILLGYFQVHNYALNISGKISGGLFRNNPYLQTLAEKAKRDRPLVVHIRRGDYLAEKDFGVLDQNYYRSAFAEFSKTSNFTDCNAIWVFSDDITFAKNSLLLDTQSEIEWISDVSNSASLTLLAMSLGSNFIIANSTFSWWAAQISRDPGVVYYPSTWFRNIPYQTELFPESWVGIANSFE